MALQHSLATTYLFTINLKCSACIFHSEQYMVQDFCQLSITILFSYECPNALDGICVLNGHYCNWSLYNCTKTQALKSLANLGWIEVSYQQLGSQATFDFSPFEIPWESVTDKCCLCQVAAVWCYLTLDMKFWNVCLEQFPCQGWQCSSRTRQ